MPELRWTLLIIGVVFIAVLAWWERRRPHQASRESLGDSVETHAAGSTDAGWGLDTERPGPRPKREPTLTLPEIRVREPASPPQDLPVVEIDDDDSLAGLDVAGEKVEAPVSEGAAEEIEPAEALRPEDLSELEESGEMEQRLEIAESVEPRPVPPSPAAEPDTGQSGAPPAPGSESAPGSEALAPPSRPEPIVDWPPEDVRRLVALRLVAPQHARFAGRAVRQALAAEGFVLGKFAIFHKPDAQNRAVLSVASLTKPGTFDLETMDTQRFGGLNLFAVLPGPKPPLKAFEELLVTARTLNERLEGALQDERGGPLTPTRVAAIRDALGAESRS